MLPYNWFIYIIFVPAKLQIMIENMLLGALIIPIGIFLSCDMPVCLGQAGNLCGINQNKSDNRR